MLAMLWVGSVSLVTLERETPSQGIPRRLPKAARACRIQKEEYQGGPGDPGGPRRPAEAVRATRIYKEEFQGGPGGLRRPFGPPRPPCWPSESAKTNSREAPEARGA